MMREKLQKTLSVILAFIYGIFKFLAYKLHEMNLKKEEEIRQQQEVLSKINAVRDSRAYQNYYREIAFQFKRYLGSNARKCGLMAPGEIEDMFPQEDCRVLPEVNEVRFSYRLERYQSDLCIGGLKKLPYDPLPTEIIAKQIYENFCNYLENSIRLVNVEVTNWDDNSVLVSLYVKREVAI